MLLMTVIIGSYCLGQQQTVTLWATNNLVLSKMWYETSSAQVQLSLHDECYIYDTNYIHISNIESWLRDNLCHIPFFFLYNKFQRECALIML